MSKNARELRQQIRNVVKEILPEVLTNEVLQVIAERITNENTQAMEALRDSMERSLKAIDDRSKDVLSMAVRQSSLGGKKNG